MRVKICHKEAKEAQYWLRLLDTEEDPVAETARGKLFQEAKELTMIFSAIVQKAV